MSPKIKSAFTCLLASSASGFAPPSSSSSTTQRTAAIAPLHMSTLHATEETYPSLLSNASLCAHSDTCSIELAESYLREIVHVQSGCAAGTLSGNAVCDDVLDVSEVVADLRDKIARGAKREVGTFWDKRQEELEVLAASTLDADGSPTVALTAPLKPAYLAIAALYTMLVVSVFAPMDMDINHGGVVPFTAQEVWWAIRDGYAADLASHAFRNGGLLVGDADPSAPAFAAAFGGLSPQEVWWSIRDGYFGETLLGASGGGGVESVPFTPQEMWWAVRDGYAADMVGHWFRNGGLSM